MPTSHIHALGRRDQVLERIGLPPIVHRLCYPLLNYRIQGSGEMFCRQDYQYELYKPYFFSDQSVSLIGHPRPTLHSIFTEMSEGLLSRCMSFQCVNFLYQSRNDGGTIDDRIKYLKKEGVRTILAWRSTAWLHDGSLCVPALHIDSLHDEHSRGVFWEPLGQIITSCEATMVYPESIA
jgi:hypothetical protein